MSNPLLCDAAREAIEAIDTEIAARLELRVALVEFMTQLGCDDIPLELEPPGTNPV